VLAERIGKDEAVYSKSQFNKIDSKVKDIIVGSSAETDGQTSPADIDGVTVESLNDHFAAVYITL